MTRSHLHAMYPPEPPKGRAPRSQAIGLEAASHAGELAGAKIDRMDQGIARSSSIQNLPSGNRVPNRANQARPGAFEVWSAVSPRGRRHCPGHEKLEQRTAPQETLRIIFREAHERLARALQRSIRVVVPRSQVQLQPSCLHCQFGEAVEACSGLVDRRRIRRRSTRRHVEFGLVPLENSTDGQVADTLDMFIKLPNLKIRAEGAAESAPLSLGPSANEATCIGSVSSRRLLLSMPKLAPERTFRRRRRSRSSRRPPPPN